MWNSGISIIKSVANLKISYHFSLEKILRSTRTLDCDKYRLKLKGKFFSFCWAIFLYFSTPISWVMSYDKKCPRFVDLPMRNPLSQRVIHWLNGIMPCTGKRVNDNMPCARRYTMHADFNQNLAPIASDFTWLWNKLLQQFCCIFHVQIMSWHPERL